MIFIAKYTVIQVSFPDETEAVLPTSSGAKEDNRNITILNTHQIPIPIVGVLNPSLASRSCRAASRVSSISFS